MCIRDRLKADLETLSYVNGKNDLYLMVDGNIWHIGLEDKSSEIVVSGISTAGCRVAENDSMLVWQKDLKDYGSTLEFMNLNSGKLTELKAGEGNFIQALGFMGEDLIYGIASAEQVQELSLIHIFKAAPVSAHAGRIPGYHAVCGNRKISAGCRG